MKALYTIASTRPYISVLAQRTVQLSKACFVRMSSDTEKNRTSKKDESVKSVVNGQESTSMDKVNV